MKIIFFKKLKLNIYHKRAFRTQDAPKKKHPSQNMVKIITTVITRLLSVSIEPKQQSLDLS